MGDTQQSRGMSLSREVKAIQGTVGGAIYNIAF